MNCIHIKEINNKEPSSLNEEISFFGIEECSLCFDNWDYSDGIFICLQCFNSNCLKHVKLHSNKKNHFIFLNIKRIKKEKIEEKKNLEEPPQKISKLAIGVPGGFQLPNEEDYDFQKNIFCFICNKQFSQEEITSFENLIDKLIKINSTSKKESNTWVNEIIQCEHTVTLTQDSNSPKLGKKSLSHCGECELTNNLWLCLTCGHLGCGRQTWVEGMSGNGHALAHWKSTNHCVVCKIGTITPEGTADIHCYSCDEERLDPLLSQHLSHFGIDITNQEKTEKSLSEIELQLNLTADFSSAKEDNIKMKNLYGPGYTGLQNLGNTCYMASILQVLYGLPEFQHRYYPSEEHYLHCNNNPMKCYYCQMGKLADGLLSGKYSKEAMIKENEQDNEDQTGIPPRMFKKFICKDHPEFSKNGQQDAYEFFQFLVKKIQQYERTSSLDPSNTFNLVLQQKIQCSTCNRVKYSSIKQTEISLPIPLDKCDPPIFPIDNEKPIEKYERESKSKISFMNCIDSFISDEFIEFNCPNCNKKTMAIKNYRFETYPKTLMVHIKRFVFEDWVPRKLAIGIEIPDIVDLEIARGYGKKPEEQELFDNLQKPKINQQDLENLLSMGFPKVRCERAIFETGNSGTEAAMNWLLEHSEDPDIDIPLTIKSSSTNLKEEVMISEDIAQQLTEMGFTLSQARYALKETNNSMERAIDWLFSHDSINIEDKDENNPLIIDTKPPKYQLFAFIVHLGSSVHCGHYVAFLKKDGKWVQFNDQKVIESLNPPTKMGYIYFFRKLD